MYLICIIQCFAPQGRCFVNFLCYCDYYQQILFQVQTRRLQEWREERQTLLKQQLFQLEKQEKVEEIEKTLKELQEKEEMIRFFELYDQIRLIQPKRLPKEKVVEEEDEEVLRAKRIKRRKFRHNV